MIFDSRLAIYEGGSFNIRSCRIDQLPESTFVMATHLEGSIPLDHLTAAIKSPLIYATAESTFNFANSQSVWVGIVPLITRLGSAQALELILTEATIDASRALQIGLLNSLCSQSEFDERMGRLSKLSISAIESAVELTRRAPRLSCEQAELLERYLFALRFAHPDQQEGMRAFIEKRTPKF
jgi:enoyl-CoA hydratase/carnithine racemase